MAAVTHTSEGDDCFPFEPGRSAELYGHVGRGRVHLLSGSYEDLPDAAEAFRTAIALDPTYAPAHAGLARTRCMQAELRTVDDREAFAEAKASALRALAMESGSVEAQVALGTVLFLAEWDWIGAERSLQRALAIDPDHTEALLQYASLHDAMGRLDEGLRLKQRALRRAPRSPLVLVRLAQSHWYQRQYDETLAWVQRALDIDTTHVRANVFAAGVHWKTGDIDRFSAQMIRIAVAYDASAEAAAAVTEEMARMKQVYATDGYAGWSGFLADQIAFMAGVPFRRAVLCGAAGRLDEAFECLDQAIAGRDPSVVYLAVAPELDPLRSDPRFTDCLRMMSLPIDPGDGYSTRPWRAGTRVTTGEVP